MKKLLQYVPLHVLACLIFGILLEQSIGFNKKIFFILFTSICLLLTILLFLKSRKFITVASLLLFFLIGVFSNFITNNCNASNYYEKFSNIDKTTTLQITKILRETSYYKKFEAEVTQINNTTTKGKLLVSIYKDSLVKSIRINDKIICKAYFVAIEKPKNPNQFDYRKYLANQQIHKQVFLKNDEFVLLKNNKLSINGFVEKSKQNIREKLNSYSFTKEELSILFALFLGEKRFISQELKTNYSKAGVIHILAISGLHVGILIIIFLFILKPINYLKNGKFYKSILTILLLWLFAFFTGLSASVVRAVTMYSFVAIGQLLHKKTPTHFSIITSMLFLLITNPLFLFNVGFQLSYSAVFAIIWVQPILKKTYNPKNKITTYFWDLITVSIAAQLGVLPLSIYYFNQLPGLFLIANIVVIPALFVILVLGITTIICSFLFNLPELYIQLFRSLISIVNSFINWIANQDAFVFQKLHISESLMFCLYAIIISSVLLVKKKTFQNFAFLCLGIICFQLFYIIEDYQKSKSNELIVFYKTKTPIIGIRNGKTIKSNKEYSFLYEDYATKAYINSEKIKSFEKVNFKNYFSLEDKEILIIDSSGIYNINPFKKPIVILQHSPKINLERMIAIVNPELIIADGSNYKSFVTHWQKVAKKEKTPFYNVFEKGVFVYEF